MKCAIVYFSGTGITPRYSHEIAKGLKNVEPLQVDFLRLKKGLKVDLSSYDLFGIGAPSYSFRAPRLATKLLRRLDFHEKPFFVFCTFNTIAGNVLWNLYKAVKQTTGPCLGFIQQGVTVNIRAWKPKKSSGKKLKGFSETELLKAKKFGETIARRFTAWKKQHEKTQNKDWKPPKSILMIIWAFFLTWRWEMLLTVGFKRVDKSKCTKCGLCATKICPSGAIKLSEDNIPKFAEIFCVGCNGCVNLCPVDAIWTYQTRDRLPYNLYEKFITNNIKL